MRLLVIAIGGAVGCFTASGFAFVAASLAQQGSPYADCVGYTGLIVGVVIFLCSVIGAML